MAPAERRAAGELDRKRAIAQRIVTTPSRLSVQLLDAFANVALRKLRMAPDHVASVVEGLCFVHRIDPLDADRKRLALRLGGETGCAFYDCLMLATALAAGCERFWSDDLTHGRTIAGRLVVLNPFTGAIADPQSAYSLGTSDPLRRRPTMALMDFIKKQFIDVIQWTESSEGVLAWRFPMRDMEIQNGASLTVRESQMAMFVDEGKTADMFQPGRYTLKTQNLPLLTNLKNWDKLFESPFKSDVYFFSTRQQINQRWGTAQPITVRDKDFGAVRIRAFGNFAYRVADPKLFHTEIAGTRDVYTVNDLDGQLRGLVLQDIATGIAGSGIPFLDLAANQEVFAQAIVAKLAPDFEKIGLKLEGFTVQSVSLPDELQKILDQKIGMGMVGNDMGKFMQYQTAQSIPDMAANSGGSGIAGEAMGLGAGLALGQTMASALQQGLQPQAPAAPAAPAAPVETIKAEDVAATLEKLHGLVGRGILTQAEFDAKKAELLKKLI